VEALREAIARRAWFLEGVLGAQEPLGGGFRPGVLGCGIVMCNVGQEALAYAGAGLPNGGDGSSLFEEGSP